MVLALLAGHGNVHGAIFRIGFPVLHFVDPHPGDAGALGGFRAGRGHIVFDRARHHARAAAVAAIQVDHHAEALRVG